VCHGEQSIASKLMANNLTSQPSLQGKQQLSVTKRRKRIKSNQVPCEANFNWDPSVNCEISFTLQICGFTLIASKILRVYIMEATSIESHLEITLLIRICLKAR
jgi:hypothetical protein